MTDLPGISTSIILTPAFEPVSVGFPVVSVKPFSSGFRTRCLVLARNVRTLSRFSTPLQKCFSPETSSMLRGKGCVSLSA